MKTRQATHCVERIAGSAIAFASLAISTPCTIGLAAAADDVAPLVSPDRIGDVPWIKPDPYPDFDAFAWRAFIALNWPSLTDPAHRGEPDRLKTLGDEGPRVWETFKARYELFQVGPDGRPAAPKPWATYEARNPCGAEVDNHEKTLATFTPFMDFNQSAFLPGVAANPLVGAESRLYALRSAPQRARIFGACAERLERGRKPSRSRPSGANCRQARSRSRPRGGLSPRRTRPAVRARYYVVENANIVDVAKSLAAGHTVCSKSDVALVGLHIVIRTTDRPQGLWSTFEHVDNVPPAGAGEAREPDARDAGAPYSYFDASKPKLGLFPTFGTPDTLPVSLDHPPELDPTPMQVVRRHPIHPSTMAMNRAYWALPGIKGTVWEHYMLVASQWPTVPRPAGPQNDGGYFPGQPLEADAPRENYQSADAPHENLVNTTIETYFQDAPSSCMACHQSVSNALGRDFVGMLGSFR